MLIYPQSQHYWDWNVYVISVGRYWEEQQLRSRRGQYENVTAKKKTITITVASMENAIRPGKSRVLVFTLVSTGARAFFLRPHPWGSHLRSHFERRGRIVRNALVGLGVWAGLSALLLFVNVATGVSRVVSDVGRMQKGYPPHSQFFNSTEPGEPEGPIVEGTVTDLDEERRKRRQE